MCIAGTVFFASACGKSEIALVWTPVHDAESQFSTGVQVFEGVDAVFPLRAWYARIDPRTQARVQIQQSSDVSDNRETVESFARAGAACLAVNGGYFTTDQTPAAHSGLLVEDGRVRWRATRSVTRDSIAYATARAAIGVSPQGSVDIKWVTSRGDTVLAWDSPVANAPGIPAELPDPAPASRWDVEDAIAAGPLLIKDGVVHITDNEEVFFGSSIPNVHPRTAAGVTEDGEVLLLVVDGRQPASRGVNLVELASILLDLGAVQALNLDGGGSSTFFAGGELLNRPSGGRDQREVMSAITVQCAPS